MHTKGRTNRHMHRDRHRRRTSIYHDGQTHTDADKNTYTHTDRHRQTDTQTDDGTHVWAVVLEVKMHVGPKVGFVCCGKVNHMLLELSEESTHGHVVYTLSSNEQKSTGQGGVGE